MNENDIVTGWLQDLNPGLELNEDGYCAMTSEKVSLVVEVPEGTGKCHIFGVVMPPPEGVNLAVWLQEAMRLNLMGRPLLGSWLAYDPEEHALFLCQNLRIDLAGTNEFASVVGTMAEMIPAVRERLTPDPDTLAEMVEEGVLTRE